MLTVLTNKPYEAGVYVLSRCTLIYTCIYTLVSIINNTMQYKQVNLHLYLYSFKYTSNTRSDTINSNTFTQTIHLVIFDILYHC